MTRILAGPYCTMQLGDMGARIIKVEPPGGDETRRWGPPFVGSESAYFLSANRNKESIVLNLRVPEGREVLTRLLSVADVLVENFRPGTLRRLGFAYDTVHALHPRLVYCSISGYGQTGPRASDPGFDLIAQGEGGLMSLTGDPDGAPTKVGTSQADLTAGLLATQGILLALLARTQTGAGQHVDVSLLDGQVSLLAYHASNYWATGEPPKRLGNSHPSITPYETFEASDGWVNVGVGTDAMWRAFCVAIGQAALADDPRFTTNAQRVANREVLRALLDECFRCRTVASWCGALRSVGVPVGRVSTIPEVLVDSQVLSRDMVISLDHPAGHIRQVGVPVKLSDTPGAPHLPPPLLGQHTERVLVELGYDAEQVRHLRTQSAIA
jgi:crotonobetainyl-CoA:carnitine CoA-transferase CaiB-like acyl-CoA transferase